MIKFTKIFPETVPGLIIAWASSLTQPDDEMFLECNGAVLTLSNRYLPLYNLIGNMYGGILGESFGLPDYSDRYLRGRVSGIGVVGQSYVKNHTHTSAAGSPEVVQVNSVNDQPPSYAAGAVYEYQQIAHTGSPAGATIGADSKPKTMYVKYYISY